jgi:group II intron reverse transcriptase/maturase
MEPKEGTMTEAPNSTTISTKLERIANLAKDAPELAFNTLAHLIDIELLREAYCRTRKDAAVGIDGQTAAEYAANLEANLRSLIDRVKSGTYRAPPVRRVHIPKGDGSKTRPIGVPTFEDKLLQRAVVMILEPIYEQDFVSWSYGFRPRRSAHQALNALWKGTMDMRGGWVIEVDIQSFFDELVHGHLREFFDLRVRDGVLRRLLGKWLAAGVLEDGAIVHPDTGTPQGGVVSPLLANIYLHYVFDRWFEDVVRPRMTGTAFAVRYADDIVIVCSAEADARRIMKALPQRFDRFGLRLHPDKTRMVEFHEPSSEVGRPETFDMLGFTHFWARSRRGRWVVRKKTARNRFARTVRRIWEWCREHRHRPVAEQHQILSAKLRGHDAYFGITGNASMLSRLRHEVSRAWRYWLDRRSQRAQMTWARFARLRRRYPLPPARVVHSVYRVAKP